MKKYTNLKKAEYDKIKLVQSAGISTSQAAKIFTRSSGTISVIFRSKDYEDYKAMTYRPKITPKEELPQHKDVKIIQITASFTLVAGKYSPALYGLGEDGQPYYWDKDRSEPQWRLFI